MLINQKSMKGHFMWVGCDDMQFGRI